MELLVRILETVQKIHRVHGVGFGFFGEVDVGSSAHLYQPHILDC